MIRGGARPAGGAGGGAGGKSAAADDGSNELVPLSLQRLRDLSESLRATMPTDDGADGGANLKSTDRKNRKARQEKAKRTRAGGDGAQHAALLAMDPGDLAALVGNMHDKHSTVVEDHDLLLADSSKNQQAFIRREVQYKSQIKRMTELLDKAAVARGGEDVGMPKLRQTHENIMDRLEEMRKTTQNTIHEQESELLRLFRIRLFQVEDKHKKAQSKKGSETVGGVPRGWLEKATRLQRDLEHYKEESIRLDAENEALSRESKRLQAEHRSHQDDLSYLEKQMTTLRRENFKLKKDLEDAAGASMQEFLNAAGRTKLAHQEPAMEDGTEEPIEEAEATAQRHREAMARLRKMIDEERARLRDVRTAHVSALASRAELEGFLSECLSDVKKQISKRRLELVNSAAQKGGSGADVAKDERDRVLQLILSQERVISLLYEKTFPSKSALSAYGRPVLVNGDSTGEDVLNLPDIEMPIDSQMDVLNDPAWDQLDAPKT